MKIIFSIIGFVLISISGISQSSAEIKIKIKKCKSKKVWVYNQSKTVSDTIKLNWTGKNTYVVDSAIEELLFIKPLESVTPVVVQIKPNRLIKVKSKLPLLHKNLKVIGSSESKNANQFLEKMLYFKNSIAKFEEKLYKDETADGQYYYDSVIQALNVETKGYIVDVMSKESNSAILFLVMEFIDFNEDYEELLILEKKLKNNFSESESYKKVTKSIFKYEMLQKKVNEIGEKAPILILPGVEGQDVSMEDLTGNYILIDFWASWCKPCRAEHPRLTRLYSQYNELGFEVYSISLDRDREKWVKAIQKDKLIWPHHVSNLSMFNSPAVKMYSIASLPSNVLVDRKGNVIEFNLKGQKLEDKLKQIFNEK